MFPTVPANVFLGTEALTRFLSFAASLASFAVAFLLASLASLAAFHLRPMDLKSLSL